MDSPGSERRRFSRSSVRIPCEVRAGGRVLAGFVTDCSASGLFVEAASVLDEGTDVAVVVRPVRGAEIELRARVVRNRRVHRGAAALRRSGNAYRVTAAPEDWYRLLCGIDAA